MSVPRPSAVAPSSILVTLSSALPNSFLTFEGPSRSSRAPTSAQVPRKLPLDGFLGSLVVARTGLWRPSFQPDLVTPCPASSPCWSFRNDLPELCGLPARPLPSQMKPRTCRERPLSYLPALGSNFILPPTHPHPHPPPPTPTPGAWLDFSPGLAVKNPCPTPPVLGSIFLLPCPVSPALSVGSTSIPPMLSLGSGTQVPQLQVSAASSLVPSSASPQTTVTLSQAAPSTPGPFRTFRPWCRIGRTPSSVHEKQDDGYVGCCSTPAFYGSRCSSADYGPWWAAAADCLWLRGLPWARHKSGSKRADGSCRPRSPSGDRSLSTEPDGLADGSQVFLPRLTDYYRCPNGREPWVITQDDANALTTTVGVALVPYTNVYWQS